jgi:hypothetical protein
MFTHYELSKTSLLRVDTSGLVRLAVHLDLIFSVSFRYYAGVSLRQTSADGFSLKQLPILSFPIMGFRLSDTDIYLCEQPINNGPTYCTSPGCG